MSARFNVITQYDDDDDVVFDESPVVTPPKDNRERRLVQRTLFHCRHEQGRIPPPMAMPPAMQASLVPASQPEVAVQETAVVVSSIVVPPQFETRVIKVKGYRRQDGSWVAGYKRVVRVKSRVLRAKRRRSRRSRRFNDDGTAARDGDSFALAAKIHFDDMMRYHRRHHHEGA